MQPAHKSNRYPPVASGSDISVESSTDFKKAIPIKKPRTNYNFTGLVSYEMDDEFDDSDEEIDCSSNLVNDNYQDLLYECSDNRNHGEMSGIADQECLNVLDKVSDINRYTKVGISPGGENLSKDTPAENCLKNINYQSSPPKVQTTELNNRIIGPELASLLTSQILNEIPFKNQPTLKASPEQERRIQELIENSKKSSGNMTQAILNNKQFRNPSIYEKLIEHMQINERGTNYPPELYDPNRFSEESYYEELSKVQNEIEMKRLRDIERSQLPTNNTHERTGVSKVPREMKRKIKWCLPPK